MYYNVIEFLCDKILPIKKMLTEAWQEVSIGQRGTVGAVHLKSQYSAMLQITSAKLKDMRNLCSYIPVEYRSFYDGLQATTPSPRKRCAVALPQRTEDVTSDSESDVEVPSSDSYDDLSLGLRYVSLILRQAVLFIVTLSRTIMYHLFFVLYGQTPLLLRYPCFI